MYLLIAVLLAASPAEDKSKDEEKIQGTWTAVSRETGGKITPEAELKGGKLIIKHGTLTSDDGKRKEKVGSYKIDPSKKPKAIDLTYTANEGKERTSAIYELDGDTLKICWSEKDPDHRPTEFTGKEGSGQTLMVLKRKKK
jgi:uncharacterized protein (TIGR03067 family)